MKIKFFNKFKEAKNLGHKAEAKTNVDLFIRSFSGLDEKSEWVKSYLEEGDFGHKIRHEVYEEVIFPVLLRGYKNHDPWALYWLAETMQNIYASKKLHELIDFKSEFELLRECFANDRNNDKVRVALLEHLRGSFSFAIHEWPTAVIYEAGESPDDLLAEIAYARTLDKEGTYSAFFSEVEEIVKKDKARQAQWMRYLLGRRSPQFVVAQAADISGRGVLAMFEDDPPIIEPLGTRAVTVTTPSGNRIATHASIEAARKVPPGEVLGMLFPNLSVADLPPGSIVTIVGD